jgi:hypothetical protein
LLAALSGWSAVISAWLLGQKRIDAFGMLLPRNGASRSRRSGQLYRPMVVAMIAVRMVQAPVHEVIDVVAMRNGFVSASRAMRVRAASLRSAVRGIGSADGDGMLVDMIPMHVVKMPVV